MSHRILAARVTLRASCGCAFSWPGTSASGRTTNARVFRFPHSGERLECGDGATFRRRGQGWCARVTCAYTFAGGVAQAGRPRAAGARRASAGAGIARAGLDCSDAMRLRCPRVLLGMPYLFSTPLPYLTSSCNRSLKTLAMTLRGEEVVRAGVDLRRGLPCLSWSLSLCRHIQKSSTPGRGALLAVLERSRLLCSQRYEKELRAADAYLKAYQRLQTPLSPKQLAVFAGAKIICDSHRLHKTTDRRSVNSLLSPKVAARHELDTYSSLRPNCEFWSPLHEVQLNHQQTH